MAARNPDLTIDDLVARYLDSLLGYACRLCGSPTEAQDLVQETFLIATDKFSQLRDPEAALAWLLTILRRVFAHRPKRLSTVEPKVLEAVAKEPQWTGSGEEVDPARLNAVLAEMPVEYREPLLLFYFRELKYREIAALLDCPIGTVMSRIARGKAFLRAQLAPETSRRN